MIVLWAAAAYLIKKNKFHWVCTIPATFMTAVTFTYLAYAKIGFGMDLRISTYIGIFVAAASFVAFFIAFRKKGDVDEAMTA